MTNKRFLLLLMFLFPFVLSGCVLSLTEGTRIVKNKYPYATEIKCRGCGSPRGYIFMTFRTPAIGAKKCNLVEMKINVATEQSVGKDKVMLSDSFASCRVQQLTEKYQDLDDEIKTCRDTLKKVTEGTICFGNTNNPEQGQP